MPALCLACQDYELFRVWDSCVLEDTEERQTEHGFSFNAQVDNDGTAAIMWLDRINHYF